MVLHPATQDNLSCFNYLIICNVVVVDQVEKVKEIKG